MRLTEEGDAASVCTELSSLVVRWARNPRMMRRSRMFSFNFHCTAWPWREFGGIGIWEVMLVGNSFMSVLGAT